MKHLVFASVITLTSLAGPVMAQSLDMSSLTPVLTFPQPEPDTVTQEAGGIDGR